MLILIRLICIIQKSLEDKIFTSPDQRVPLVVFFVIFDKNWWVPKTNDESRTHLDELQVSLSFIFLKCISLGVKEQSINQIHLYSYFYWYLLEWRKHVRLKIYLRSCLNILQECESLIAGVEKTALALVSLYYCLPKSQGKSWLVL